MSVELFRAALEQSRLLQPEQWDELKRDWLPRCSDAQGLARQLRVLGWLTPFQVERLFQGRGQELTLGDYVLLDRIGEGGMARVFKARHPRLNRTVALKILRPEMRSSFEAVRRFQREIRALAQLSHPNVIHVYDAEEIGEILFYIMEYCEGIDLNQMVQKLGPLPIEEACDYMTQAAQGLQHIHGQGVIHRDIKPANLLLTTGASVIKILDLGLASLRLATAGASQTALTREWTMMGTPDYVAPEQIMNAHMVDARADLYSLGCTFYYLLVARPPFVQGKTTEKLLMQRSMEAIPVEEIRPEVPKAVAQLMRRLMAKKAEERVASATELLATLAELPV